MKIVTGMIISFVWMIAVFLIGFILIAQLTLNATANASGALIGSAATNWTNFVTLLWVAVGLLAFTPLINFARTTRRSGLVLMVFAGLFGAIQGHD
jgi:hypothetical protein